MSMTSGSSAPPQEGKGAGWLSTDLARNTGCLKPSCAPRGGFRAPEMPLCTRFGPVTCREQEDIVPRVHSMTQSPTARHVVGGRGMRRGRQGLKCRAVGSTVAATSCVRLQPVHRYPEQPEQQRSGRQSCKGRQSCCTAHCACKRCQRCRRRPGPCSPLPMLACERIAPEGRDFPLQFSPERLEAVAAPVNQAAHALSTVGNGCPALQSCHAGPHVNLRLYGLQKGGWAA